MHEHELERLISRRLDRELTDDEELALNRELIRRPDANRTMEQSRCIDELASGALRSALGTGKTDPRCIPGRIDDAPARAHRSTRWLIPGAIAAAILAMVVPSPQLGPVDQPNEVRRPQISPQYGFAPAGGGDYGDLLHRVTVPTAKSATGRDIIGVVGEDGNLYWIEVDRTRTVRVRPPHTNPWAGERM